MTGDSDTLDYLRSEPDQWCSAAWVALTPDCRHLCHAYLPRLVPCSITRLLLTACHNSILPWPKSHPSEAWPKRACRCHQMSSSKWSTLCQRVLPAHCALFIASSTAERRQDRWSCTKIFCGFVKAPFLLLLSAITGVARL